MKTRRSSMATRAASWVVRGDTTTTPRTLWAGSSRSAFAPTSERGDKDMKSNTRNLLAAVAALACLGSLDAAAGGHRGPDRHPGHQPPLSGEIVPVEIY